MADNYLIDANIFITAHREYYSFDIAPSFWEQLIEKASDKIIIIERVKNEIQKGGDELTEWYNEECSNFKVLGIPDNSVIEAYREIINSVNKNTQYLQSAKEEFASVADSWLCSYGLAYDYTIVTLETYDAYIRKRIKIPNICEEFDIKYINLSQFMREVGIRL